MLTINRKIFLFEFFAAIMFFCQYRVAKKQGYILFLLEISIGCLCWLWSAKKNEPVSKILLLYFFLILYKIILTLMVSGIRIENVQRILYKELGMLFLCYVLIRGCSGITIIKRIREFGLCNAFLGCYEFITHSNIFARYITVESRMYIQSLGTSKTRVQTVFMHPTICGVFMMISWLCVLFVPYRKPWIDYLAKVSIILCLLGTQSRSTWVAFIAINIFYIWEKYKGKNIYLKKEHFFRACIVIMIGFIITISFNEYISSIGHIIINRWRNGMDTNNASNYNRMTMIRMGIQEWMRLGIGRKIFGSGNDYAYKFLLSHPIRGWNGAVDNQYLTILLDFGLVGVFFILSFICYILKKITVSDDKISQLCGLCLLSMLISGFFYEMFSWIFVTLLFCTFLCILEKNTSEKEEFV